VFSARQNLLGAPPGGGGGGGGGGGAARRASPYRAAWVVGAAEAEGWSI
jgi:hypothetical protein